ncbi:anti-sigma factor family protein [Oryzifoliimicrobium ureilyticus]|uniref:anti-sigma factor family protein n=1 Tax=Oryzifoliimicrobium ureilyticus TaxID=3113724 RepID=UPI0030762962
MRAVEAIADADLHAYVDGELEVTRRVEVESYLSQHPEIAAKVMADLSMKGELRLALADENAFGKASTRDAARRLERGLSFGRVLFQLQRAAAVALFVGAGWVAHNSFGAFTAGEVVASVPAPPYVDAAVKAYRTSLVRSEISSPSTSVYRPDEIRAATAIVLPTLPADWKVSDVQIFPSDYGPSVETTINVNDGKKLSLFAVRPGSFAVSDVRHIVLDGAEAAYWQIGDVAYALVSGGQNLDLDRDAEKLARSLY